MQGKADLREIFIPHSVLVPDVSRYGSLKGPAHMFCSISLRVIGSGEPVRRTKRRDDITTKKLLYRFLDIESNRIVSL